MFCFLIPGNGQAKETSTTKFIAPLPEPSGIIEIVQSNILWGMISQSVL
jgi:hypothetical protein